MPIKNYGLLKGTLKLCVPYYSKYNANPHFVFVLDIGGDKQPTVVVNSMSNDGTEVGIHTDFHFEHPLTEQIQRLGKGFPAQPPRLDYLRDRRLTGDNVWTPIPYEDDRAGGSNHDINDLLAKLAGFVIDPAVNPPQDYEFFNGKTTQTRDAFGPTAGSPEVTVYAFGQIFPDKSGAHDSHMTQGAKPRDHFSRDNGIHQDGAIFFEIPGPVLAGKEPDPAASTFRAHFTVFSSQYLPTDSGGYPLPNAVEVCPPISARPADGDASE